MEQTDKVVQFIQGLRWSGIPGEVKHQAKRCLLDTLGALLAGTRTPVAGITAELAVEQFPAQ